MICTVALLCALPALAGEPKVEWSAPDLYVSGMPFEVSVTVTAPEDGAPVAGWMLTPSAFTVNGKPLAERTGTEVIGLAAGSKFELVYDLAPAISASGLVKTEGFDLAYAKEYLEAPASKVRVLAAAPADLNFMELPVEQLDDYWVVMLTNQGAMTAQFWPDVAPNHVRNFLDLSYTKFYDGLKFHRVMAGFMIQGGDPLGTGTGGGPRKINAEFSQKRHVRGVLSAARLGHDINSATSQFFVVHGTAPGLDGKYSAFGQLVDGLDVLDKIATTEVKRSPGGEASMPVEEQILIRAIVVKAPAEQPAAAKPVDQNESGEKQSDGK
jgi:cyclophilin family peptidyl-prolyl cis-trans isomerase